MGALFGFYFVYTKQNKKMKMLMSKKRTLGQAQSRILAVDCGLWIVDCGLWIVDWCSRSRGSLRVGKKVTLEISDDES